MEVLQNLIHQTAFANNTLDWRNVVMIFVAFLFLYLAIKKGYEPLLLVPIAFGMLLVNIYPPIIEEGGLLHYFFMLDEWSILPSLILLSNYIIFNIKSQYNLKLFSEHYFVYK